MDWDGYMANPLLKYYFLPPTNTALPGSATITASGTRFYFNQGSISSNGPSATFSFNSTNDIVTVGISIFPAHQDPDPASVLTIVFTDAYNAKQTNTVPILVIDQDAHRTNDFVVTANFDQDATGFFDNPLARLLVTEAANDWTHYFADMHLDTVQPGAETTFVWSNNFDGGDYVTNTNSYVGYQLYAYGTTNDAVRSGGEGSFSGDPQSSGGVALNVKRSGGFEANIMGNFNTLGWLFLTNDADWLATQNLGDQTNGFYSIAHHEIGHALIFNEAHPGFATALANGAFTSDAVTNYYGRPVPIDASNDHLTGVIDPESGQGAFGYEYYGNNIPRCRWTMTKLDLLCAQEVGYPLRQTSAFAPFAFPATNLPTPVAAMPYSATLVATGGIPIYNWKIYGNLPYGLELDTFTGIIHGVPRVITASGQNFTIGVSDYHEGGTELFQSFYLDVQPPSAAELVIALGGEGTNRQVRIGVIGIAGDRHIVQVSSDMLNWTSVVTNVIGPAHEFEYNEPIPMQTSARFYRAVYAP